LQVKLQQEPGLEIVAEAEDGETAVEMVKRYLVDVVLLDIGLPGIGELKLVVKSSSKSSTAYISANFAFPKVFNYKAD
jgi:YesN/AraC family two-component response regulator